ncbi:MAG: DUF2141 domain-containing protein [Bacteroidetes bacterium]|nr:DUF2141 domain-containing protein [Bacteroidota bacterium]
MKLFLLLFFTSCLAFVQTLKINISGIRNSSGTIRLAFYNTSESFDKEKPMLIKIEPKTKVATGALSISYTGLKPGVYGIAILDDENSNQKMDYGLILPKEGFGFSDYYHTGMSRPKFESFDFIFKNENKTIEIKLRYL